MTCRPALEVGPTGTPIRTFMKIALVQQSAGPDKDANVARGLAALGEAARAGAEVVVFPELAFERFHPQRPAGRGS